MNKTIRKHLTGIALYAISISISAIAANAQIISIGYPKDFTTTSTLGANLGERNDVQTVKRLGQTFEAPQSFTQIEQFSIWLSDSPVFEPQPTTFNAVLMEFKSNHPSGLALYQSSPVTMQGLSHGEMKRFDFNIGVTLEEGKKYIMFFDVVPYLDGINNIANASSLAQNIYSQGGIAYTDSSSDLSNPNNPAWSINSAWDLVFRAEFSPTISSIPEPATYGLVSVFAVILLAVARTKKRLKAS